MCGFLTHRLPHCANSGDLEEGAVIKEITNIFRAVEVMEQNIIDADRNSEACKFAEMWIKHSVSESDV
jgi:hypothetical protein